MPKPLFLVLLLLGACASRQPTSTTAEAGPAPAPVTTTQAALQYDRVPAPAAEVRERLRPYLEARPGQFHGWLPGTAGILIGTRFGQTMQLHTVAQAEGARRQITFYDEPVTSAVTSTDPRVNGMVYARDRGGDEYYQLYFQRFDSGTVEQLTRNEARNERPVLAHRGGRFAYSSTARNGQDFDIWLGEIGSGQPHRLVHQPGGTWYALDFSHDGSQLLLQHYVSILDSRLVLLDLNTLVARPLLPAMPQPSANPMARFSHDDQGVYYLSDHGRGFVGLHYLDLASGKRTHLTPTLSWDVVEFALGAEDTHIATLENVAGSGRVLVFARGAPGSRLDRPLTNVALGNGVISSLHFNEYGTELGFLLAGAQIPGDVLSISISTKQLTRWTRNETGGIDPDSLVVPREQAVGSFDTGILGLPRQIPGFYYQPQRDTPAPVVIMVHGGPESQALPGFDPFIQFLVRELKYAVLVPNVRGSAGYGRDYLALDDGIRRGDAVKDLGAWIEWARAQPELDPQRVVVYGGSYGGFMVLAALAEYSDLLAGGVDIVGISNFVSFLENTNPYRRDQRRQEYGDERDPAVRKVLEEISPLNRVDGIRKPLFVIQGANDPRVPRSEAEQIVQALRSRGQDVWYLLAMNEGHGFRKKENLDAMRIAVVMWLERLFAAPAAGSAQQ